MGKKRMFWGLVCLVLVSIIAVGWKFTSRTAYESAAYAVLEQESSFELREYAALQMATTEMRGEGDGRDGSFGRLFGYITGNNAGEQQIAMTTPVFMDMKSEQKRGTMGFVLPREMTAESAPEPASDRVSLQTRPAGRYAVYRFAGRISQTTVSEGELKLREWIRSQGMTSVGDVEVAGYDPPWTPGPFRRNEVLIPVQ